MKPKKLLQVKINQNISLGIFQMFSEEVKKFHEREDIEKMSF